jgi:Na+:H+ antiporter, NhaA family
MERKIKQFLSQESSGGILLMLAVALAMILANSPLSGLYQGFLDTPVQVRFGQLDINKPLLLWVNDGLMALFFLLIGLEVKRELIEGALSSVSKASLPTFAALGGMVFPALVYLGFNFGNEATQNGWAIPAATDIAFALGVLALLGNRVPVALKVFLLALAIIDDIGVIVIIALFYSTELSVTSLVIAAIAIGSMVILNLKGVRTLTPYALLGLLLWIAVLKSGVHATLAGVVIAFCIPLKVKPGEESPSRYLEHSLHPWSTFMILPLFAFANAGLSLAGMSLASLAEPAALGVMLGLLLGKPIGVLLFSYAAVKLKWASLPQGVNWQQISAIAVLCGVGFTMSIFISSLAFEHSAVDVGNYARLGTLVGSMLSASIAYFWLTKVLNNDKGETDENKNS